MFESLPKTAIIREVSISQWWGEGTFQSREWRGGLSSYCQSIKDDCERLKIKWNWANWDNRQFTDLVINPKKDQIDQLLKILKAEMREFERNMGDSTIHWLSITINYDEK